MNAKQAEARVREVVKLRHMALSTEDSYVTWLRRYCRFIPWNPSPKVADCREIARKWGGKHQVIIIALDRAGGTIEMATYGQTKALCDDAKRMGDAAYQAVYDNYEDEVLPGARPHPAVSSHTEASAND